MVSSLKKLIILVVLCMASSVYAVPHINARFRKIINLTDPNSPRDAVNLATLDATVIAAGAGDITGVTAGVGISGGGPSGPVTVTFAPTELDAITWDGGTAGSFQWKWDLSAGDLFIDFSNDLFTFNNSVTITTGDNFTLGTTQWNKAGSDEIDGTKIKDADYGDINVSAGGAWTLDIDVVEEDHIADNGIDSEHYNDDSIDDAHINWGSGAIQVDMDDIGNGSTNAAVTLTQETNWDTHLSSDGTDHTYIDQDLQTTASPTFANLDIGSTTYTFSSIDADGSFAIKTSGDNSDYFYISTVSDVPVIGTVGNCDLKITSSSGEIILDDNTTINGTLDCGAATLTGNLIIPDAGYIGSTSDTDAMQIEADGDVAMTQDLAVTGTGTFGGLAVDTDTLVVDTANNRVGIGTASPSKQLHVAGSGTSSIRLSDTGAANDTQVNAITEYYRGLATNRVGWMGFGSSSNDNLSMTNQIPGGDIILTPTATGKVGIGGHLFTMGDDSAATDSVMSFLSSGNDGTIIYDQTDDEHDFSGGITVAGNAAFNESTLLLGTGQDYNLVEGSYGRLSLQGQTAATPSMLSLHSKDGDESDDVGIILFGRGQPTQTGDLNLLSLFFDASANKYILKTVIAGDGVDDDLQIIPAGTLDLDAGVSVHSGTIHGNTTASTSNPVVFGSTGDTLKRSTSSGRYKTIDSDMTTKKAACILNLKPRKFYSKCSGDDPEKVFYGLIAEEVAEIYPEAVVYDPNGLTENYDVNFILAALIKQVQTQDTQIKAEKARNDAQDIIIANLIKQRDVTAIGGGGLLALAGAGYGIKRKYIG